MNTYTQDLKKHAQAFETERAKWQEVADKYEWENRDKIFVQLFVNDAGKVTSSVSHLGLTEDGIYYTEAYND